MLRSLVGSEMCIRDRNNQHHVAAIDKLSARLDKLAVMPIASGDNNDDISRRRASPRRVRFNEPESRSLSRSPSPGRYYDNNRPPPAPSRYYGRLPSPVRYNSRPPNYFNRQPYNYRAPVQPTQRAPCYRCGTHHLSHRCIAENARCNNCSRIGHFTSVCRSARRGNCQRI